MPEDARIATLERENRILKRRLERANANLARLEDLKESNSALLRSVITQMEEAEEELLQKNEALVEATAAKSIFLANMSHELRTPLNAVIGYTEYLLEDPEIEPLAGPELSAVVRASRGLLGLLNDILDLTKIESGRLELEIQPFDFQDMLVGVVAAIGPLATGKGLTFELEVQTLPGWMVGDQLRVRQILVNLLSNAIKFTETGLVRMCGMWVEGTLQLCVRDTGVGMSPSQVARVFEPFVQADVSTTRRFGGTGLGLSIARSLARKMGGELRVESVVGEGTLFCLSLPATLEGMEAQAS